jgi:hypothetical protein
MVGKGGEATKRFPMRPGTIVHSEELVKNYRARADNFTALPGITKARQPK